jgi:hypothetical protein
MVVADAIGDTYNGGPVSKLTLPGLKSGSPMYTHVYGAAAAGFSGGFAGDAPNVAPDALATAVAAMKGRMNTQIHTAMTGFSSATSTAFADLAQITYSDEPSTEEPDKSVRLHEKAHVDVPMIDTAALAVAVSKLVSSDAPDAPVSLVPLDGFAALPGTTTTVTVIGTSPLQFSLSGQAQLVWQIDTHALSEALAGRDSASFQGIIKGFSSIQDAHARLAPFWSETFPKNQTDIVVSVTESDKGQ